MLYLCYTVHYYQLYILNLTNYQNQEQLFESWILSMSIHEHIHSFCLL